jgi:hypothetical protein
MRLGSAGCAMRFIFGRGPPFLIVVFDPALLILPTTLKALSIAFCAILSRLVTNCCARLGGLDCEVLRAGCFGFGFAVDVGRGIGLAITTGLPGLLGFIAMLLLAPSVVA